MAGFPNGGLSSILVVAGMLVQTYVMSLFPREPARLATSLSGSCILIDIKGKKASRIDAVIMPNLT